jgi:hypothetical protein
MNWIVMVAASNRYGHIYLKINKMELTFQLLFVLYGFLAYFSTSFDMKRKQYIVITLIMNFPVAFE